MCDILFVNRKEVFALTQGQFFQLLHVNMGVDDAEARAQVIMSLACV